MQKPYCTSSSFLLEITLLKSETAAPFTGITKQAATWQAQHPISFKLLLPGQAGVPDGIKYAGKHLGLSHEQVKA
ncbi:MAG: hypothetical protein H6560_01660 [Lewinellaceae bacterium]|nr:hypothetical protein [Lewinellaceae bacterium]